MTDYNYSYIIDDIVDDNQQGRPRGQSATAGQELKGLKMATKHTVQVGYNNTTIKGSETIDPSLVKATGQNAEPTSRLLDGSEDHGYAEEWQEPALMPDGRPCYRMYLFDSEELIDELTGEQINAEDYPWDDDHVRRIILVD